ncbi:recombinase family protein [Bacillus sp. AGMB 02131]|uniref:Recombinase family protein n=1 Tax=Peribacillus faecalis TaxID=2772559 RepID=A0A927CUY5_9BACI|nr:recombinase family protein [Peribacillus faecalis]MBD3108058.1 recombinase family protein [Peribacillus faecalis]
MENKYKIFVRRVSSKGQDLAMQESADAPYRQQYLPKEIMIIDENDVSANKLKISERPEMMKVICMILNNQVDTIYAFDRSRLFRDFYEANYFVSICRRKNVRIFFTSTGNGHLQATDNLLVEGVLNIVGDFEGKNIARRTEEARRRYPAQKLGYIKEINTKQYIKNPNNATLLKQYFTEIAEVSDFIEIERLLKKYKKDLNTTTDTLLRIIGDPFYSGYDLFTGKNKLHHVDPYISLTQFNKLKSGNSCITKYIETRSILKENNIYKPICGICQKPMNYRFKTASETSFYTCSRKHIKIEVTTDDLSSIIDQSLNNIIDNFDFNQLVKDSKQYFKKFKRLLEDDLKIHKKNKNNILEEIIIHNDNLQNWREHPRYQELANIESKVENSLAEIRSTEKLLIDNENIVKLIKDYLINSKVSNAYFLFSMLIEQIYVYQNEVNLVINKFDYISKIQEQYIFEKGES